MNAGRAVLLRVAHRLSVGASIAAEPSHEFTNRPTRNSLSPDLGWNSDVLEVACRPVLTHCHPVENTLHQVQMRIRLSYFKLI